MVDDKKFDDNKKNLYERARLLQIDGRSRMSKDELRRAIAQCMNDLKTSKIYVKTCKH